MISPAFSVKVTLVPPTKFNISVSPIAVPSAWTVLNVFVSVIVVDIALFPSIDIPVPAVYSVFVSVEDIIPLVISIFAPAVNAACAFASVY